MTTKFNYQLSDNKLLDLVLQNLDEKLDLLPSKTSKKEYYQNILKSEIDLIQKAKFDGYILLVTDMIMFAKTSNISIDCFGTIQNSLMSYLLEISQIYKQTSFLDFILFEKKPTINIVASTYRYHEIIGYLEHKYSKIIKNIDNDIIYFNDKLQIKFIDLNVDVQNKPKKIDILNLGLECLSTDINLSQSHTIITDKNQILLGLDSCGIGEVLANRIIREREEKYFSDFDDLVLRVPLIKNIDEVYLKMVEASFWQNTKEYLKINELKDGYIYKIIARNAKYGAWIKDKNAFMISRWKFNRNYLFLEYHWDYDDLVGTVKPTKEIEKFPFEIKAKNEYNQEETKEILKFLNNL